MGISAQLIEVGESSTNISNLSESALNSLKKSDLVQKILDLKGKLLLILTCLSYPKLTNELVITKNMNSR